MVSLSLNKNRASLPATVSPAIPSADLPILLSLYESSVAVVLCYKGIELLLRFLV